jgi:hypothetical protein
MATRYYPCGQARTTEGAQEVEREFLTQVFEHL